ncbi:DNA-binding transcriptional regulator, LysR family [Nocardioides scoriae]|uniref:DNA-binding transcriptional regulator, LysR family n=1 Tax=Nocardioides scoriae TaxID=642780 RepID=A0A1H1XBT3_9ACTN|nr:LysR family transcriptional regulator [Nocardioides scoriae]SDT06662.1 DNA-binding transcriptional regulator, LysR family [Nocardioides scoriae]
MIDLDSLDALAAVDAQGSVHAAALALGFTPSAVSQQVKRLERQVGLPLLERVGRGVILTGAGRQLVDDARGVRDRLEQITADLHRSADQVAGRLRITAFSTAVRGLVAPAVRRVLAEHPDLALALHEHEPWEAVDLVATGRFDLGIVHSWGDLPLSVPEHVVATTVAHDVADVVVPVGHPLAGRDHVTPHDLLEVEWVATAEGTICRQWLTRMYVGTGASPRIAHVSGEFASHLALVRAGLGVALVPRLGREDLPDDLVAVTAVDPVPERTVSVLHRRTMAGSPAVRAVVAALRPDAG